MSGYKEFVNKPKWEIRFVPWKQSDTGIMVHFKKDECEAVKAGNMAVFQFSIEEAREFGLDLAEAVFKRFDVSFPRDIEPSHSKEELARRYKALIEKMERKHREEPFYVR